MVEKLNAFDTVAIPKWGVKLHSIVPMLDSQIVRAHLSFIRVSIVGFPSWAPLHAQPLKTDIQWSGHSWHGVYF